MKKIDKMFLIIICFIMSFGFIVLLRDEKQISYTENRTLSKIPNLTFTNYLNGTYQKDLESGLSDQFIGSETIKKYMNQYTNVVDWNNLNNLICKNEYIHIKNGGYVFDCSDYITYNYQELDSNTKNAFNKKINVYNKLNDLIPVYYYFVNTSYNYDFSTNTKTIDMKKYFENNMNNYAGIGELNINNFEEYKKMFYKTDHHWNYYGSYTGYKDVASMMGFETIYEPVETRNFNINYLGSTSKMTNIISFYDPFTVYRFDLPKHDIYINGVKSNLNRYEEYENGDYSKKQYGEHYNHYYRGDYGETIFDYKNSKKENLLIIADSFSNSVRELIAANFNKTYEVDLRHYENFDFVKYIKEQRIDKILIIGNLNYYISNKFLITI